MDSSNIVMTGKERVEVRQEKIPPLPEDSLLVRTRMSLISTGTECICYRGDLEEGTHWAGWVRYPFYPGYSNVGTVEQVGTAVEGYQVGDRVFSTTHHRQYHLVKPPLTKIPESISDASASWSKLGTIAQTGVRRAELTMGARVVVIGLGPLGQLLTQYTRVMGAEEVLAIDPVESRLAVAAAHGATRTFAGSAADAVEFVEDHTAGHLADVVFDATGHYAVFPLALKLVRDFGTMMLIGDSPHPGRQVLTSDIVTRQITVRGSHNERLADERKWTSFRQIELLYSYLERGQMRVDDLITARHAPGEAPDVYAKLLRDRAGTIGVAFDWSQL
jgi:2-desacetyl-2-hydroxyethyl bacteriochlorophyllide A dehydrogenase